jgi:hypothetical protein
MHRLEERPCTGSITVQKHRNQIRYVERFRYTLETGSFPYAVWIPDIIEKNQRIIFFTARAHELAAMSAPAPITALARFLHWLSGYAQSGQQH